MGPGSSTDDDIERFAVTFQRFLEGMALKAASQRPSPFRDEISRHLGGDADAMPVVTETFPAYDHPNVQVAIGAFLERGGGDPG